MNSPIPPGTFCMRCQFRLATRRIRSATGRSQVACDQCAEKAAHSWVKIKQRREEK